MTLKIIKLKNLENNEFKWNFRISIKISIKKTPLYFMKIKIDILMFLTC